MSVLTLLRKEVLRSRRRLLALLVVVLLLPAAFAYGTLFFEHTLPEDTPVAVVAGNASTTEDDLTVARAALTFFSEPRTYDTMAAAREALLTEHVYAIVQVPPGLTTPDARVTFDVFIHGTITPYRVPSRALLSILSVNLDGTVPSIVEAERHIIGPEKTLSEYLLPTFLMTMLMLIAFTYLPYDLASERDVLDRLRVETSLAAVVGAKLAFFVPLVLGTILAVYGVGVALGYALEPLSLPLLGTYLLTFVYLAGLSVAVMLLTGFDTLGRVINVAIFFALVPLSNLAYPVGFFSSWSGMIAQHNPLHHSMVIARSFTLKDVTPGAFTERFVYVAAATVLAVALLALAIRVYERRY